MKLGVLVLPALGALLTTVNVTDSLAQQIVSLNDPCINTFMPGDFPTQFKLDNLQPGAPAGLEQTETIVRRIMDSIGMRRGVDVYTTPEVSNACAVIVGQNNRRTIYFSEQWLNGLANGDNWVKIGVIAHEMGHHINNHTREGGIDAWNREYEADAFAGRVIRLLGGTIESARKLADSQSVHGSNTHPPKELRVASLEGGFKSGGTPEPSADGSGSKISPYVEKMNIVRAFYDGNAGREEARMRYKEKFTDDSELLTEITEKALNYNSQNLDYVEIVLSILDLYAASTPAAAEANKLAFQALIADKAVYANAAGKAKISRIVNKFRWTSTQHIELEDHAIDPLKVSNANLRLDKIYRDGQILITGVNFSGTIDPHKSGFDYIYNIHITLKGDGLREEEMILQFFSNSCGSDHYSLEANFISPSGIFTGDMPDGQFKEATLVATTPDKEALSTYCRQY